MGSFEDALLVNLGRQSLSQFRLRQESTIDWMAYKVLNIISYSLGG